MTNQFHNSFIDVISNNEYTNTITTIRSELAEVGTFAEEACRAARLIAQDNIGKTIYILCSGGQDSQIVVRSFLKENIPVKLVFYRALNDAGQHVAPGELLVATAFAKTQGAELLIEDVHLAQPEVQKELKSLCDTYRFVRPQDAIHMLITNRINTNNNAIVISGTLELSGPTIGATVFRVLQYEQVKLRGAGLILGFYVYTPELIVARFRSPIYQELLAHGDQYIKMHQALIGIKLKDSYLEYLFKSAIYEYEFPDISPTAKFAGNDEGVRLEVDFSLIVFVGPTTTVDLAQLVQHLKKNDGSLLTLETIH